MQQQAWMLFFSWPNHPSASDDLGAPSLDPFIVPARQRVCSPPSHFARATRAPFLRPYKLMPPGCHLPSPPGAEGAQALPRVSPRAFASAGAAATMDGILFPAYNPSPPAISGYLFLNPSIGPPACESARPPLISVGRAVRRCAPC